MKKELNPADTSRAQAYEMWVDSIMPMVTLFRDIDVTHLLRYHRRTGLKINMLLCYCIARAASRIPEFYVLPKNEPNHKPTDTKLVEFDHIGINTVVRNAKGGISWADITLKDSLDTFNRDYLHLTAKAAETCQSLFNLEQMNIGVSNLANFELEGVVNQYNGWYNNPFLCWGKFRRQWTLAGKHGLWPRRRTLMRLSFQFHHVQMDGEQACTFLEYLQEEINRL